MAIIYRQGLGKQQLKKRRLFQYWNVLGTVKLSDIWPSAAIKKISIWLQLNSL